MKAHSHFPPEAHYKINIQMDLIKKQNYLKINSLESVKRYLKNHSECSNTDNYRVFICQEHWGF